MNNKSKHSKPKETNYDNNVIVYGRVKLESGRNGYLPLNMQQNHEASTSNRLRNEQTRSNKEITELKSFVKTETKALKARGLNFIENENDILERITLLPESSNRLKSVIESKVTRNSIREALVKIANSIDSTNNNNSNKTHVYRKGGINRDYTRESTPGTSKVLELIYTF